MSQRSPRTEPRLSLAALSSRPGLLDCLDLWTTRLVDDASGERRAFCSHLRAAATGADCHRTAVTDTSCSWACHELAYVPPLAFPLSPRLAARQARP